MHLINHMSIVYEYVYTYAQLYMARLRVLKMMNRFGGLFVIGGGSIGLYQVVICIMNFNADVLPRKVLIYAKHYITIYLGRRLTYIFAAKIRILIYKYGT